MTELASNITIKRGRRPGPPLTPEELQKSVVCTVCGAKIKRKYLTRHIYREHKLERVCCTECGKSYKNKFEMQVHWDLAHKVEENKNCKICNRSCQNERKLRKHFRYCASKNGLKTPATIGSVKAVSSEYSSKTVHKDLVPGSFTCNLCRLIFPNMRTLKLHTLECLKLFTVKDNSERLTELEENARPESQFVKMEVTDFEDEKTKDLVNSRLVEKEQKEKSIPSSLSISESHVDKLQGEESHDDKLQGEESHNDKLQGQESHDAKLLD